MKNKHLILGAALATAFLPALAEETDGAPQARTIERHVFAGPGEFTLVNGDVLSKDVKNAPYSAESVTERQQTLSDGNQISKTTTSMSYRDSAGRTRHEMREPDGEVRTVTIKDPAERVTWILRPQEKSAMKIGRIGPAEAAAAAERGRAGAQAGRAAAEAARAHIEQLRKEGKLPRVERKQGSNGEEIIIRQFRTAEAGKMPTALEMRTRLAPLATAFGDAKWSSQAVTKDLGTREFEGVKAQGKLRSYEIPAGAIGNRDPITVSDESWYSPDLQVTVYSKHSDPRMGDSVYRLQNIKRGEQAASLFTVPSDYKVRDMATPRLKREAEPKAQ